MERTKKKCHFSVSSVLKVGHLAQLVPPYALSGGPTPRLGNQLVGAYFSPRRNEAD